MKTDKDDLSEDNDEGMGVNWYPTVAAQPNLNPKPSQISLPTATQHPNTNPDPDPNPDLVLDQVNVDEDDFSDDEDEGKALDWYLTETHPTTTSTLNRA